MLRLNSSRSHHISCINVWILGALPRIWRKPLYQYRIIFLAGVKMLIWMCERSMTLFVTVYYLRSKILSYVENILPIWLHVFLEPHWAFSSSLYLFSLIGCGDERDKNSTSCIRNFKLVFGQYCIIVLVVQVLSFDLYFGLYIRMICSMYMVNWRIIVLLIWHSKNSELESCSSHFK